MEEIGWIIGAVLGAIFGLVVERLKALYISRVQLRKFRHVLPLSKLTGGVIHIRPSRDIIASGNGGKSKRAYTHSAETIALHQISRTVKHLPITLDFQYDDIDTSDGNGWIIFGTSRRMSKLTNALIDHINMDFSIRIEKGVNSHGYFKSADGNEYHCEHTSDDKYESRVTKDYGIIYRGAFDDGVLVLLCGGIHMFGTLAAVETAFSDKFIDRVKHDHASEYVQLVEVGVHEDGINIISESKRWEDLPFAMLKTTSV